MPPRVRHALRFGITTLVAVYLFGVLWELFDVFVRDEVPQGWTAARTFWFNEMEWRWIAGGEAVAVFLLRLSDVHDAPPAWPFAWASGLWLAVSSVAVTEAMWGEHWGLAATLAVSAAAIWFGLHYLLPRAPGRGPLIEGAAVAPGEGELR